jgi:phosphotransferase system enzyme I (PtsI)
MRRRLEQFVAMSEPAIYSGSHSVATVDGLHISLRANTDLPHEVRTAKRCGAEGIGLFRTEFLFFAHSHGFPGVDSQLEAYRMLAQEMSPYPVAVRTLDSGADKTPAIITGSVPTLNASMGLRGIRLSLLDPKAFCQQIEAILRAARFGKLEIVLPMVTTIEEIREAKRLIDGVRAELVAADSFVIEPVPVGVMLEVPAAVFALEAIAGEADFLCVGTNDLIQYMLAVDRCNSQVSHLFQPLHPSILHCLKRIADVCRDKNKPVRICGEMSSNPFFVVLLVGMGFSDLSMNAFSIPTIRRIIQEIASARAREIALAAMTCTSAREVGEYLIDAVSKMIRMDLSAYVREVLAPNDRVLSGTGM